MNYDLQTKGNGEMGKCRFSSRKTGKNAFHAAKNGQK